MRWLTIQQYARSWGIPESTLRRWAVEDRDRGEPWPRTRTRPYRYDPDAVDEARIRREPGRAETLANLRLHQDRQRMARVARSS